MKDIYAFEAEGDYQHFYFEVIQDINGLPLTLDLYTIDGLLQYTNNDYFYIRENGSNYIFQVYQLVAEEE